MSECHHSEGSQCFKCDKNINLCCRDDGGSCDECGADFCNRCLGGDKDSFECPKCNCEIIDDSDLLDYLLEKYSLERSVAEEMCKKQMLWDTLASRTEKKYDKLVQDFKRNVKFVKEPRKLVVAEIKHKYSTTPIVIRCEPAPIHSKLLWRFTHKKLMKELYETAILLDPDPIF